MLYQQVQIGSFGSNDNAQVACFELRSGYLWVVKVEHSQSMLRGFPVVDIVAYLLQIGVDQYCQAGERQILVIFSFVFDFEPRVII